MADPSIAAVDTELLVEHFYRELADERAASARRLLSQRAARAVAGALSAVVRAGRRGAPARDHARAGG